MQLSSTRKHRTPQRSILPDVLTDRQTDRPKHGRGAFSGREGLGAEGGEGREGGGGGWQPHPAHELLQGPAQPSDALARVATVLLHLPEGHGWDDRLRPSSGGEAQC